MTEFERIQACLSCPLTACVEDLPLLRNQCSLVQIEVSEKAVRRAVRPKVQKSVRTAGFAARVRQMKYYLRTKGAAQQRYEASVKGKARQGNRAFDPATLRKRERV